MTAKLGQYQYIEGTAPTVQACHRIVTNQRGDSAFFFEPLAADQVWEGQTSLATGIHQQYLVGGDPGDEQQYIIVLGKVGNFQDDEVLAQQ